MLKHDTPISMREEYNDMKSSFLFVEKSNFSEEEE